MLLLSFLFTTTFVFGQSHTPVCFSDGSFKQGHKELPEVVLKRMMKDLTDREVFARLVLAETYASTCPSQDVAQSIAWVIRNRVLANNQARYGLGREVVFKPYQFRSSTGDCDVAKRSLFLCPTSLGDEWRAAWDMALKAVKQSEQISSNPIPHAYQYFFYRHFEESVNCAKWKGVIPDWAKPKNQVVPKDYDIEASCFALFR